MGHDLPHNGPSDRSNESCCCEHTNCNTPIHRTEEICQGASNNGQRGRREGTAEESAQHDGVYILCNSNRNLENGEEEVSKEQWQFTAKDFGSRTPDLEKGYLIALNNRRRRYIPAVQHRNQERTVMFREWRPRLILHKAWLQVSLQY